MCVLKTDRLLTGDIIDLMKKKEITIEDLAMMVQRGFNETASKADLNNLSKSIDKRFDRIENMILANHRERIEKLEGEMKELKNLLSI